MNETSQAIPSDADDTSKLDKVKMLLSLDQVVIPKALSDLRLHEKTTLFVSEIITDNKFMPTCEVKNIIALALQDNDTILNYADNDEKLAKKMKKEIKRVIDEWDTIFPTYKGECSNG